MSDIARLRQAFAYDPETGCLTRLKTGKQVRTKNSKGYFIVCFQKQTIYAHRLAWLLATGQWPTGDIDHINGNPSDNRLSNLRDVSRSENLQNRRKPRSGSSTGLLGVSLHKSTGKYNAQIWVEGRNRSLGLFDTAEKAHEAYVNAKKNLHKGFIC